MLDLLLLDSVSSYCVSILLVTESTKTISKTYNIIYKACKTQFQRSVLIYNKNSGHCMLWFRFTVCYSVLMRYQEWLALL